MKLFEEIDKALDEIKDGWCIPPKAHLLASCIILNRPKLVVEIGVWAGRSLIPMAMACRENGFGHVIGIDPWDSKASAEGMTGQDLTWWSSTDHEPIYQAFIANLKRLELENWVTIHRAKSQDVPVPDDRIDVLSLDGNHSEQAIDDVNRFGSAVRVGGIVLADDLNWSGGGVSQAVERLKSLGFEQLVEIDQAVLYKRTKRSCP